ncbi:hypothetical protein VKT23_017896 [Stygiomarasmius scandens]|uniref:Transposase n=1 Tax=Marasmiellus scandens TaxID=2682957 RepID=A0ABR1IQV5_9AGAR
MGKGRRSGVSMSVKYRTGSGRFGLGPTLSARYGVNKRIQDRKADARYIQNIAGLSKTSQDALNELAGDGFMEDGMDMGDTSVERPMDDDGDNAWINDPASSSPAPGSVQIDVADLLEFHRSRYMAIQRTWRNRLEAIQRKRNTLIGPLTDAFIRWKYNSTPPSISTSKSPNDFQSTQGWDFGIEVFDIYNLSRSAFIPRNDNTEAAVALVHAGFLGNTPEQPSFAISLQMLELLYTIRLYKASFSIESFARVLCHTYAMPYRRFYRTAVSNTFDIYLDIQQCVDKCVLEALGHNTPHYRVLHICPACCYKLENKPYLKFSRMWVCDSNNSLRRMAPLGGRRTGDTRVFGESNYFLPTEFVDKFTHKVKSRPKDRPGSDDEEEDDAAEGFEEGGDPTDGSLEGHLAACTKNWKVASADAKKRMWNVFLETRLFASACRHGFILWLTDMVRSGELAKYGLAMVATALEVLDDQWVMAYNISCSFSHTINASSLGSRFNEHKCCTCVNAFHGYSHNFLCQLLFHPLNIDGMGLEDLETLERIFSASNQLASITCYATAYCRHVLIDIFFRQWDEEKYQNLANMLHNNYLQALETITTEGRDLSERLAALNLTTDDLERYFVDEEQHFKDLGKETEEDLHAVAYVELLQQYWEISKQFENASTQFRMQTPRIINPFSLQSLTTSISQPPEKQRQPAVT